MSDEINDVEMVEAQRASGLEAFMSDPRILAGVKIAKTLAETLAALQCAEMAIASAAISARAAGLCDTAERLRSLASILGTLAEDGSSTAPAAALPKVVRALNEECEFHICSI